MSLLFTFNGGERGRSSRTQHVDSTEAQSRSAVNNVDRATARRRRMEGDQWESPAWTILALKHRHAPIQFIQAVSARRDAGLSRPETSGRGRWRALRTLSQPSGS